MPMKKIIVAAVFATAILLIGVAWAQEISPTQGVFSGIVTKVDPEGRNFSVRGEGGERLFQWNRKTSIIGFPTIDGDTVLEFLKEGPAVKVFYTDAGNTRMAGRIEVKKGDIETLKGWEHPFGCGTSLC